MMWALIVLPVATLLLAWLASQITPAFVSRYFAPVLAAILLLAALGSRARAGIVGLVAIVLSVVFPCTCPRTRRSTRATCATSPAR